MDNEQKMNKMMEKKTWALIGATPNKEKISNQIYHTFKSHGYEVYAINPKYEQMDDGSKCYPSLNDLPKVPDCVNFVVPPPVTRKSLEDMDPKKYPYIWLQPGTYNNEIIKSAEEKGFTVVHEDACTMGYLRLHKK
ncbi:MAG: CoA-binding protein [Anaerovoracaceae bacterium]|jgi:predicted CoA-binding protein